MSSSDRSPSPPAPVRILGIDPGSRITGYGLIDFSGSKARYVAAGTLVLPQADLGERLLAIYQRLRILIETHVPTQFAIEQVFVHRNANSALVLGHARGAALIAALESGLKVHEYAPNRIKQAVTGRGHAEKQQVQHMVKLLLNLDDLPELDAADALAVAICHAHLQQTLLRQDDGLAAESSNNPAAAALLQRRSRRRRGRTR